MTWEAKPISPVAVVGIDCRFPGAADKNAFWDMLIGGGHGITEVPAKRWDAASFHSSAGKQGTANTTMAGFIADPDVFDHGFFGVSPHAAGEMDPQQRLLLQASWRAVEDAAIDPTSLAGSKTGVYVGVMSSEWALLHLRDYHEVTAQRGTGNGYHMAANRVSYHLDLKGPSVAVDTACSSSLVALHMAVTALCSGECDLAITAGVNLILTPALSIFYTQAGLSAPDGQCKPFSARANGIGRGEGVGVVVLRRLEDALAHQQPIYAVIDGSAINHDGRSNGITAPNRWSQQQVIGAAYARAGVRPNEIHFVEAHGTGTVLGDMIEVKALGAVHAVDREHPCALGSVKGNIGHTEGAAGIAGVIKACLALNHRLVPPSRHSDDENTDLRLPAHGLRLARAPIQLPADGQVRAAVSSFGLGGTNAHVVLSTPPAAERPADPGGVGVLTVSADTAEALQRNISAITEMIDNTRQGRIAQLCYSTNLVKSSLRHRFALAASKREELVHGLRDQLRGGQAPTGTQTATPRLVFLFTGQGAQYPRMTSPLYHNCPAYRERFDEVDAAMRPHLGHSIASVVLAGADHGGLTIDDTCLAQPALFAVGYALGAALRDLGVCPDAMIGHSIGEYAAACLSGVLTLSEACGVVVSRGALMQRLPDHGAMLAVRAPVDQVRPFVDATPSVTIAAYNGPRDLVISGAADAVAGIEAALDQAGVATAPLRVSHAFHSPLMRPIVPEFSELAAELPARVPTVPFASTLHGRLLNGEAIDGSYWANQVTAPVRFDDALRAVRAHTTPTHLIEVGPAPALLGLARRAGLGREVTGLVPCPGEASTGREVAKVLAELYRSGLVPRWQRLYTAEQRVARRLPPYVFEDRARFWTSATVTPKESTGRADATVPDTAPVADSQSVTNSPVAQQALAALAEVGGYATSELPMDAKLLEDLGYDSITLMRLTDRLAAILRPERAASFTELLPQLTTVADVLSFVATRAETA